MENKKNKRSKRKTIYNGSLRNIQEKATFFFREKEKENQRSIQAINDFIKKHNGLRTRFS